MVHLDPVVMALIDLMNKFMYPTYRFLSVYRTVVSYTKYNKSRARSTKPVLGPQI